MLILALMPMNAWQRALSDIERLYRSASILIECIVDTSAAESWQCAGSGGTISVAPEAPGVGTASRYLVGA